jgi:hypothetical protein
LERERHVARTVPTGAIVNIEDQKPFDGEKLMDVIWDARKVMMFTQDLKMRSTRVADASGAHS